MRHKRGGTRSDQIGTVALYTANSGQTKLAVTLEKETVWLTQKQMANLFQKSIPTINEHIKNIFKEHELSQKSVIRKSRITAFTSEKRGNGSRRSLSIA